MAEKGESGKLTLFDVVNLVVGAIIGADIYVASSFGAGLMGPGSMVVWLVAGIIAIVLALCFAQCASLVPRVGGTYAYAKEAWGTFAGFMVGWSLWLAEWMSLAVFPVAFLQYLMYFLPDLGWAEQGLVKLLFVAALATTNIVGIKAAGRANDTLTVIKMVPLLLFIVVSAIFVCQHPSFVAGNYTPLLPLGLSGFGSALVLIFWAYAGFEIAAIPADEIKDAGRTIPKAIVAGITIVTVFYLTTNALLFGVRPWTQLALDTTPLTTATADVLGQVPLLAIAGSAVIGVGALFSIAGSDESGMIGTSSLGFALAVDGLFPKSFATLHKRFGTPYLGIIVQSVTAFLASLFGGLAMLVTTAVFLLAVGYAATSASTFALRKKNPTPEFRLRGGSAIAALGLVFSLYLITQCSPYQIVLGSAMLLVGVPIYAKYSPKKELTALREAWLSNEIRLRRAAQIERRFLAHPLHHIKIWYRRRREK
jgi:APA family basic amino acid/polyamine antiporter